MEVVRRVEEEEERSAAGAEIGGPRGKKEVQERGEEEGLSSAAEGSRDR